MTRLLALALAFALPSCIPDARAQSIGGGSIGGGGSGASADPTPVFDFDPGIHGSGVQNLASDAFAMTTVVECDARDDTATDWPCDTGGTFTESDGAGNMTEGRGAPFTEQDARATWFDRLGAVRAPTTSVAEVGSGVDVSMIVVASLKSISATQYVASKYDTTNSQGWGVRVTAGNAIQGVANATTFGSYALDAIGQWNIIELQCDSGATNGARLYVNGQLVGSAANCPSDLTTTTSARNFSIGCRPNGSSNDCIDGSVAYVRVQTCSGCMTSTADQDAVALQHAMQIMGVWPTQASVEAPILIQRDSPAYVDIKRDLESGTVPETPVRMFRVGNDWMRVGRRVEQTGDGIAVVDGRAVRGLFMEPEAENLLLQSHTYGTTWTKITAADSVITNPGVLSPSQEDDEVDRLEAALDGVGVEHGVRQAVSLSASYSYMFSAIVGWTDDASVAWRYLYLRDATLTNAIGWFDLQRCQVLDDYTGSGLKNHGTGINQGTRGSARVRSWGMDGLGGYRWCRVEVIFDGTTASHNLDIGASKTAGTTTQTASAAERVLLLHGSQLERTSVAEGSSTIYGGERSSSYIPTTTVAVTREADFLRFDVDNWPVTGGTALGSYLLEDGRVSGSSIDYTTTRTVSMVPFYIEEDDQDNIIHVEQTAEAQTYKHGYTFYVRTNGTYQWTLVPNSFLNGRIAHRDGRFHWARAHVFTDDGRIYLDGGDDSLNTQTSLTLPTFTGAAGISIGYAHGTNVEWARGLVHRVAFWSQDYDVLNP